MRRTFLLLALLLAMVLGAMRWTPDNWLHPAEQVAVVQTPAATPPAAPASADESPVPKPAPPAPTAAEQVAAAGPPAEEVEPGDTEQLLDKLIPRRSAGHAAGLNKVPDPLGLNSSVALVVDANSKQVKLSKNQDAVLPIASLTKLMTGLVIAEAGLRMDELISVTDDDVDMERHSRSRLKVGTTLTRAEALRLALMSSENRAAHALGRTYPAGLQRFVAAMNAKAHALGMAHTTYVDPTGLSASNQSSAHDLALLALEASRHPLLREYSTTPRYRADVGTRTMQYVNSNGLVRSGHWDIELQKTGYIIEAGHCTVMHTHIGDRDWVMVLLDATGNASRSADAERIRRWIDPNAPLPPVPQVAIAKKMRAIEARHAKVVESKRARGGDRQVRAPEGQRIHRTFAKPK